MIHSIQCVHCKAVLKVPAAIPAGKKVKCPKCQQTFTYAGDTSESSEAPAPVAPDADRFAGNQETAASIARNEEESVPLGDSPPEEPSPLGEEETPRPRKKPRRDDADDDEEAPRSKKKRNRDEEDDERSRTKIKKKKAAGSSMLLWMLVGGGVFGLFACCACGAGGVLLYVLFGSAPKLAGSSWETFLLGVRVVYTFNADGTGTVDGPAATIHITYSMSRWGNPPILETKITRINQKQPFFINMVQIGTVERFRVTVRDDNNMTLTPHNQGGLTMQMRRIK